MFTWILNNIATILICAALLAVVTLIIVGLIKNKKKGKSSCSCGCDACPMSGKCREHK